MNPAATRTVDAALQLALAAEYIIERPLGEGGMATVYLATDVKHGRRVALKVLRPALAASVGAERFRREIRIAAGLAHPNILPLYDSGDLGAGDDGPLFFVMPFVEGDTLRARLTGGPLPIDEAVRIAIEVADALDYAHRRGIVHRDIKPENILLLEGHAVVTDFGIAHAVGQAGGERLTHTGMIIGTPAYLSPEQLDGEPTIDGRSDVFSLSAVLYEMLTGSSAFGDASPSATMARVASGRVIPLSERRRDVPPALAAAVHRGLEVDREKRFQSARALSEALRLVQVSGTPPTLRRPRRRRAVYALLAALVVVVVIGGAVVARRSTTDAASLPSLAILPFATAPADTASTYLGVGIAEQLIDALSDVPGLRVTSRTSSFALGAVPNVKEIGQRLGVAAVLEGSVTTSGSTVHVTARLIDPATDRPLWGQQFDEPISGVADVQERIAKSIVQKLRVRLASDSATIFHRRSKNAEAHDLVLRARYLQRIGSRAAKLAAVPLLARAAALDSTDAEVPVAQSSLFGSLAVYREQDNVPGDRNFSPGDALRFSREAAERAVRLDSLSSLAHTTLGAQLFRYDWNWALAEREFKRGIELNPTSATAYGSYSRFLRSMGRFDEARRMLDRSAALQKDAQVNAAGYARISFFAGDYARSERELAGANHAARTWTDWYAEDLASLGRFAAAESLLVSHEASDMPDYFELRVYVLARMGNVAAARDVLRAGRNDPATGPTLLAGALVALGDTTAALDEIEHAVAQHDPLVVDLAVDPRLDPLRRNARFVRILDQLHLPRVR